VNKIFSISFDNASANTASISSLKNLIDLLLFARGDMASISVLWESVMKFG
jgi:hypothetical protein